MLTNKIIDIQDNWVRLRRKKRTTARTIWLLATSRLRQREKTAWTKDVIDRIERLPDHNSDSSAAVSKEVSRIQ
ncbi:hypothetical protein FSO04_43490 [Paraburkholderia madseniana]|uniref:Uncharacterized protein n=1 Tax=Paraburkholderia madseniana TaxID=2599607 RepID=A0A6N6VZY8_9BURK|nr:hypothetical protein [Paraburkholderia madseniana]KAE8753736.1 hypothetical protein FSO04_43490 [Paraburkholderia madseniana]NPT67088.1 hypothetical protein [Paraburkholderia madseniana]